MSCPGCEEAKQFMKSQGFRNWLQHACEDHAAVDLDEFLAERGHATEDTSEQSDLFGNAA